MIRKMREVCKWCGRDFGHYLLPSQDRLMGAHKGKCLNSPTGGSHELVLKLVDVPDPPVSHAMPEAYKPYEAESYRPYEAEVYESHGAENKSCVFEVCVNMGHEKLNESRSQENIELAKAFFEAAKIYYDELTGEEKKSDGVVRLYNDLLVGLEIINPSMPSPQAPLQPEPTQTARTAPVSQPAFTTQEDDTTVHKKATVNYSDEASIGSMGGKLYAYNNRIEFVPVAGKRDRVFRFNEMDSAIASGGKLLVKTKLGENMTFFFGLFAGKMTKEWEDFIFTNKNN